MSTLLHVFSQIVVTYPEKRALSDQVISLTYKQLDEEVNYLANLIVKSKGFTKGGLVLMCLDRGVQTVIGLLAVLKAGGAYVPISPSYPKERISYILKDTDASVVMTLSKYEPLFQGCFKGRVIPLDTRESKKGLEWESAEPPHIQVESSDLAYVLYTSGTTGRPKGVMIEHGAFISTLRAIHTLYFEGRGQISTYSMTNDTFDIFGLEYGLPLISGGHLELGDPTRLGIDGSDYDFIQMTPSVCYLHLDYLVHMEKTLLFLGGESLKRDLLERVLSRQIKLVNLYGPTETTIWSSGKLYLDSSENPLRKNLIGQGFQGEGLHILDEEGRDVDEGELCISGTGLARGYLNSEEQTAKKFLIHPIYGRIYRSGDLVRKAQGEEIEYLQRMDTQVKIRGFRIECGEVEALIAQHKRVNRAVVTCAEGQRGSHLVAYYKKDSAGSDREDGSSSWAEVFDHEYEEMEKEGFTLWKSSYTGEPIPREEMKEWRDQTVKRIASLKPQVVYEIGGGNGLLLFKLIGQCKHYMSSDLSQKALDITNELARKNGVLNRIETHCSDAMDFSTESLSQTPDTIILNSVIQYFPGIPYFEALLMKLVDALHEGGTIFIGDIRDYRLLVEFHHSVLAYQGGEVSEEEVHWAVAKEKELLVSPEYFVWLQKLRPEISRVELLPREGRFRNEMNDFRYDVILHVNKKELEGKGCPLNQCFSHRSARSSKFLPSGEKGFTIEEIHSWCREQRVFPKAHLSLSDPSYYLTPQSANEEGSWINYPYPDGKVREDFANEPVLHQREDQGVFQSMLKDHLSSYLPDYMIPSAWVELNAIPLNSNGKVDYNALPTPTVSLGKSCAVPKTKREKRLRELWGEVLGIESTFISCDDPFFRLGGDSIGVIRLLRRIDEEWQVRLKIGEFAQNNTVASLSAYLDQVGRAADKVVMTHRSGVVVAPLSFGQEGLAFIDALGGGTHAYNIPLYYTIDSSVDQERLKQGIEKAVLRHEVLRSTIERGEKGEHLQWVQSLEEMPLPFKFKEVETLEELHQELLSEGAHVFRLEEEYPIRMALFSLGLMRYLSVVIHHIAFDGWSIPLFLKEIEGAYDEKELPPPSIQYKDYAFWQRSDAPLNGIPDPLDFWKGKLEGYETLNLLTDLPRPMEISYRGEEIPFVIPPEISNKIRQYGKDLGVSLYTVLLSAYYLMLRVYCYQNDLVIGTTFAGRNIPEAEGLIGLFVRALPLRVQIDPTCAIKEFIQEVGREVAEAQEHQEVPFESIVKALEAGGDKGRHPIFQVLFEVDQFAISSQENRYLKSYVSDDLAQKVAKFDVSVHIDDTEETLKGGINYCVDLFDAKTVRGWIETYFVVLEQFVGQNSSNLKIDELNYLSKEQRDILVTKWNETETDYPIQETFASLFEEVVKNHVDQVALVDGEERVTYRELNSLVNRWAHFLKEEYELQEDDLVVVITDRNLNLLVAMLAIFKAGAAYLPIDPALPSDRVEAILNECGAKGVLIQSHYLPLVEGVFKGKTTVVDRQDVSGYSDQNLSLEISPTALAYVIYTSGSTGRPKGAMVEYKGMINHLYIKVSDMEMTEKDVVAETATQSFDVSVWQFISALMVGGRTVIFRGDTAWEPHGLLDLMDKEKVTIFQTVPSHMYGILPVIEQEEERRYKLSSLRWMMINGEPLPEEICERWFAVYPEIPVINAYGPTECSDDVTHFKIYPETLGTTPKIMPIHGTLGNTKIYITNDALKPVPLGAIGELVIGGVGVGRGYLKRSDLTSEKFAPNPFPKGAFPEGWNDRLYLTGDLVRYLQDGQIEYISRKDFQVKIRGFRIELGEIEEALTSYEGVLQSVVLAHSLGEGRHKDLVGYYTASKPIDTEELSTFLRGKLPNYMVPKALLCLPEIPLTINGKIDRKKLPKPEFKGKKNKAPPRNSLEKEVAQIWGEMLGAEGGEVGIFDDFFHLGGDSIISLQLVSRLRYTLGLQVTVRDIFNHKTIACLMDALPQMGKREINAEQGVLKGSSPYLSIQEWFFGQKFSNQGHWNQSFMIKTPPLEVEKLEQALQDLISYHDAIRLRFDGNIQTYTEEMTLPFRTCDVSKVSDLPSLLTEWQSHFNIDKGPMGTCGYLHGFIDGSARIFFALHHLIVDTVSWRILAEDLESLYRGNSLGNKGTSYRQWVEAVQTFEKKNGWETETFHFPKETKESTKLEIEWSQEETRALLTQCGDSYHTQINDLLLAALAEALPLITGRAQNDVTLEGHGREPIEDAIDLSRTMGWFTTLYPVSLEKKDEIGETIKGVKEKLLEVPNKGLGYKGALPSICFNYLGQLDKGSKRGEWALVDEYGGETIGEGNLSSYTLDILGWVIGGRLKFEIDGFLARSKVKSFAEEFKRCLSNLIKHTKELPRTYLTPSDVGHIVDQPLLNLLQEKQELSGVYRANSLQQGFIFRALSEQEDDAYAVQLEWSYEISIDPEIYKRAWEIAQEAFPPLRMRFYWGEKLLQIIDRKGTLDFRVPSSSENVEIEDREEHYNLMEGPLFRVYLIKESGKRDQLLLSYHHAILDGWSNALLLHYVHEAYEKLSRGESPEVREQTTYIDTQRYLQKERERHLGYWKKELESLSSHIDLNYLVKGGQSLRHHKVVNEPRKTELKIDGENFASLKKRCQELGVTLNATLQYVWHKVLHIYGRSDQTCVGTITSGRNLPIEGIEKSVGLFINTLPLVIQHESEQGLEGEIQEVQRKIHEINERCGTDLGAIQKQGERIFESLFVFENYPEQEQGGIQVHFEKSVEKLDYPLGVLIYEKQDHLLFIIQYAGELFAKETVERFLSLVDAFLKQIGQGKQVLELVKQEEKENLLKIGDRLEERTIGKETLSECFERQVERTPLHVALTYKESSLTYKELNEKANKFAHFLLRCKGVNRGDFVPLVMERSERLIIAIIGCFKAGCAYVPLDPTYPTERIASILEEVGSECVIDTTFDWNLSDYPSHNPSLELDSRDLAYVIYTSGSTGKPKGVMIEHRGVVNLAVYLSGHYLLHDGEKIVLFANPIFDASVEQMTLALLNGYELVIPEKEHISEGGPFFEFLRAHQVTHLHVPPPFLPQVEQEDLPHLRRIISGGDTLHEEMAQRIKQAHPNVELINEYGPTETTITATTSLEGGLSIGQGVANSVTYVLDRSHSPLPPYVIGELFIGGVGVARGYFGQDALTAASFIDSPFIQGETIYRTGDLAYYDDRGNLFFVGREDFQVKIRGYRIECGEVEATLLSFPGIEDALVLVKDQRELVAYYVSNSPLSSQHLREHLAKTLPEYMVPNHLIFLEKFPVHASGKVNRSLLPPPQQLEKKGADIPITGWGKEVCAIWEELLDTRVGIHDDFFLLGGDSITTIQLASRMRQRLGVQVSVREIFQERTIANLMALIESRKSEEKKIQREEGILEGRCPLLPIQSWFFDQKFPSPNHWNQSFYIETPKLDPVRLKNCVTALLAHHDALRLRFKSGEAFYSKDTAFQFHVAEPSSEEELINMLTKWQKGFDLEKGPLVCIAYLNMGIQGRIYVTCHHLIIDAVSWRIFAEDLKSLYEGKPLEKKGSSYRQWGRTLERWEHWSCPFEEKNNFLRDRQSASHNCAFSLSREETQLLLRKSHQAYNTEINDLLLSALALSLTSLTGEVSHPITLEGHGREEIDPTIDLSRTIGWFTTQYPVILKSKQQVGETIKGIKERIRAVPHKGLGYKGPLPKIGFNYLGQFDQSPTEGMWKISQDLSAVSVSSDNLHPNTIDINGWVSDGQLTVRVEGYATEPTIETLGELLRKKLQVVIAHVSSTERSELTPSDIDLILSQSALDMIQQKEEIEQVYLAKSLQRGFIYQSLSTTDDSYIVQLFGNFDGPIEEATYKEAWLLALRRFPALRLNFSWEETPVQVIKKEGILDWHSIDLTAEGKSREEVQKEDRNKRYDLSQAPLFRVYLLHEAGASFSLLFSMHHSILDGWSLPILFDWVHQTYATLSSGDIPEVKIDRTFFSVEKYLQSQIGKETKKWQGKVQQIEERANLSGVCRNPTNLYSYRELQEVREKSIELPPQLYRELKEVCQKGGVTLNSAIQYAWHRVLYCYGNVTQTVVGTVISGRELPIDGIEESVGLYIETLPLILDHKPSRTLIESLQVIQKEITQMQTQKGVDLSALQIDGERLFYSLFVFDNYPKSESGGGLSVQFEDSIEKLDYPLGVVASEMEGGLIIKIQYDQALFSMESIRAFLNYMEGVLREIAKEPGKSSQCLTHTAPYIPAKCVKKKEAYPTFHAAFEAQVERTPNEIALSYCNVEYTYCELNAKANQLAHYLKQNYDIQQGALIPFILDRGAFSIVALLAILKVGGAYVPLDPKSPKKRVDAILREVKASFVIDVSFSNKGDGYPTINLEVAGDSTDLAYVIYTSGSTGRPKGVMVAHQGILLLAQDLKERYGLMEGEKILLFASLVFDASVEQIALALFHGYELVIPDSSLLLDEVGFQSLLNRKKVTHLHAPPLFLGGFSYSETPSLRRVISGGDRLTPETADRFIGFKGVLINEYGPTEATITATSTEVEKGRISIGTPVANTITYILDPHQNPLPQGAIGELYLGGPGLALGYLNQEKLTAECFIPSPFHKRERLYRTGDLAFIDSDGQLMYVGRRDFQVKIRGYRVELGEIESAILQHRDIEDVVVTLHKEKELVTYYVSQREISTDELETYCSETLPSYMVPHLWVQLPQLPVGVSGKLDRKQLPSPNREERECFTQPANALEKDLVEIWGKVLGIDPCKIGMQDQFFRLGGDSIISIQIVSQIRQKLNLPISVSDLFKEKTVRNLARALEQRKPTSTPVLRDQQPSGSFPLLPIQEWFFAQNFEVPAHWNQSFVIHTPRLDRLKLEMAVKELVNYHDAFRLRFDGKQQTYQYEGGELVLFNCLRGARREELEAELTRIQKGFDLKEGPLAAITYIEGNIDGRVHFAIHHLIVDAISWRILAGDLQTLYEGGKLPEKGSSYRQWVQAVDSFAPSAWDQPPFSLSLPKLPDECSPSFHQLKLSKELTHSLLTESGKAFHAEINDLLLSALSLSLPIITGEEENLITLEGHGREEIDPQIDHSRTVGWFTTLYPVLLERKAGTKETLKQTKETLRKIPHNGMGYKGLLSPIWFNYLGQVGQEEGSWKVVPEELGVSVAKENRQTTAIDINGWVSDGVLNFTIEGRVLPEILHHFKEVFHQSLIDVVNSCALQLYPALTPSDIGWVISDETLDSLQKEREIEAVFKASSLQQGFVSHSIQYEEDDAYVVQMIGKYHGMVNPEILKASWEEAQKNFPALRLRFDWKEEVVQVVEKDATLPWCLTKGELSDLQKKDRALGFELEKGPLFRLYLNLEKGGGYSFMFSHHHTILDGWSAPLLFNFVHRRYAEIENRVKSTHTQDESYFVAQRYLRENQSSHKLFWEREVDRIENPSDLSFLAKEKTNLFAYREIKETAKVSRSLDPPLYASLVKLCKEEGITLNAVAQYLWHQVLRVYGFSQQTVVGTVISGRELPVHGVTDSVGLYINTLPLILDHNPNRPLVDVLKEVQDKVQSLNTHSGIDLASLTKGRQALFFSLLIFENYPNPSQNSGPSFEVIETVEKLNFPLNLHVSEGSETLTFQLEYASELFSPELIESLMDVMVQVADQIPRCVNQDQHWDFLTPDCKTALQAWSQTAAPFSEDKTIPDLFERQVLRTPENIAIYSGEQKLSYEELNQKANQVAHFLKERWGVQANSLVALCLDRSADMVIAILGVLKAGGAYLPVDPDFPKERIDFLIQDSKSKGVIAHQRVRDKLSAHPSLFIDRAEDLGQRPKTNPRREEELDIAYVIYTSGTTGVPKGVKGTHQGIVNRIEWMNDLCPLAMDDKILQKTPYTFDVSIWEFLWPHWYGASLVVAEPEAHKDPEVLIDTIERYGVTICHFVPSMLSLFEEALIENKRMGPESLTHVFCSGEPLLQEQVSHFYQLFPKGKIYNLYGPTEASIDVSYYLPEPEGPIRIGKPIHNLFFEVLDPFKNRVPVGAVGELYVGGVGVAKGYLNREDLTRQRFITSPFNGRELLYRTGDLVCWTQEGELDYLGRIDAQVKLHGQRIELEEIETQLNSHPLVEKGVVALKGASLVGYTILKEKIPEKELVEYLSRLLPSYMVPKIWVSISSLPFTSSGKLDRKALPSPSLNRISETTPDSKIERTIREIWSTILTLPEESIGTETNFFAIGGSSIDAIRMIAQIRSRLKKSLKVADLYASPTIKSLAKRIERGERQLIFRLNRENEDLPKLFMIHPGAGGCEVYASLAKALEGEYVCYGIDSYNLYAEDKISSVPQLADYYLNEIKSLIPKDDIHIMGWSLGGLIALEMGVMLEGMGKTNIRISLLDTTLEDPNLKQLRENIPFKAIEEDYHRHALHEGYASSYIQKVLSLLPVEHSMLSYSPTKKLTHAQITLFKAGLRDETFHAPGYEQLFEYIASLPTSNIERVVEKSEQLNVIHCIESSHHSILREEGLIRSKLTSIGYELC